jgi:flagellar assembly protein FliH
VVTGPTGDPNAQRSHAVVADVEPPAPERLSHLEREAFVKGYAQGERSGGEATTKQGEAMLRRLAATIDEVASLRTELMRRTERELVNLALVLAERIVRREVSLDRELLVTMARVAIDRLGERASATIRLNPADHAALTAGRTVPLAGPVEVVADPHVSRGGCLVRSDFGLMDLGIEAQINELSRALLGADESADAETSPMGSGTGDV